MTGTDRPRWLGIELRHLTALSAVAQEGSFRGAADRLGYVQSAISQQVAHLEEMVGARLVDRRRGVRAIAPTPAGALLLEHFGAILARFAAAQADIDALQAGGDDRLRVGVPEQIAGSLMPRILAAYAARFPEIELRLEDGGPAALADAVLRGRLDVAFGERPLPAGPFAIRDVLRDPYVLLVSAGSPLAGEQPVGADQLGGMTLVAQVADTAAHVDAELRQRGIEPDYRFSPTSQTAVQALVAAGLGAAIMPRASVNDSDARTVAVDLGELIAPRSIVLYRHADRRLSPTLEAFLELAAAICEPRPNLRVA